MECSNQASTSDVDCTEKEYKPKVVANVSYWPYMPVKGKMTYSVGSKEVDRYLRIGEDNLQVIMEIIHMMDGNHTISWIEQYLEEKEKVQVDVRSFYNKLRKTGLIVGEESDEVYSEINLMGIKLINYKFRNLSERKRKFYNGLWMVAFVILVFFFIAALLGVLFHPKEFDSFLKNGYLYDDSYLLGAIIASIVSIINIFCHELSHSITAIHFGLQPSQFQMVLYGGFKPLWLIKIKGIYTVKRKERVSIMGAGLCTNLGLMCFATTSAMWLKLPVNTVQILSKVLISNYFMILTCLSPFKLSDGYYIITQLLGITNLRMRIIKSLRNFFGKKNGKMESFVLIYFLITVVFMGSGIYFFIRWNYNISLELSSKVSNLVLSVIVGIIPFVMSFMLIFTFIQRFIRLMKTQSEE